MTKQLENASQRDQRDARAEGSRRPCPPRSDTMVVRVYYWSNGGSQTRTYIFSDCKFMLKEPVVEQQTVRSIYRIVFFALDQQTDQNPLLVIDVQPHATKLELKSDQIKIDGEILDALHSSKRIELHWAIEIDHGQPSHKNFTLVNNLLSGSQSDRLAALMTERRRISYDGGLASAPLVEEGTGLVLPEFIPPTCTSATPRRDNLPQVYVSFPFIDSFEETSRTRPETPRFHVLQFEFKSPDHKACQDLANQEDKMTFIRTFWKGPDEKNKKKCDENRGAFLVDPDSMAELDSEPDKKANWRLVQRPSTSISHLAVTGSQPLARWLLHVYGLPTYIAVESWNYIASDYYIALNRVQGGRPVSFAPKLDRIPTNTMNKGWWVMTYHLQDNANGSGHVEFLENQTNDELRDAIVVTPLSLHFWKKPIGQLSMSVSGRLEQINNLEGSPVAQCRMTLQEIASDNGAELERFHGVVLNGSSAMEIDSGYPQIVRMGSLDLEFGKNDATSSFNQFIARREASLVGVHIDVNFKITEIWPGGQDDPAGEEYVPERSVNFGSSDPNSRAGSATKDEQDEYCLETRFRRKRPIVVYDAEAGDNTPHKLTDDSFHRLQLGNVPPDVSARLDQLKDVSFPDKQTFLTQVQSRIGNGRQFKSFRKLLLSTARMPKPFLLRVREDVKPGLSQVVRLEIQSQKQGTSSGEQRTVIVLDRNPFLVAQVRYSPFDQAAAFASNTIAQWSSGDVEGASWKLQFDEKNFSLILPPQAVGEEMVKDKFIDDSTPFRFNLSPATVLDVDPRQARTRFTEAPWNLRRILGTPGEPTAGPLVVKMQYELLYGLTCDATNPAIRLAEIFSRVGRIAARRDQQMLWPGTRQQRDDYRLERESWSKLYRRYLARVAVLEPWNSILPAPDKSVVLNDCLSCRFRLPPNSNLKAPFEIGGQPGTLHGGATWGFESKNIYSAVTSSTLNPKSSSANLSDFYISSLGGWGHQMAGFQNDLTKIYADVSMGRTYRYKLERLGRIGAFWNLAKHVIIYERTVVRSEQFATDEDQLPLTGWPVIRKVREYVEILEDERAYPDSPEGNAMPAQAVALRSRGFVASCNFNKGAQFNVSSSWGSDVEERIGDVVKFGWKVPLWRPGTDPAVYAKPKVSLGVVSNLKDTNAIVPIDIAEPQNVVFFTQTKIVKNGKEFNPDKDPHRWEPFKDIDWVNSPRPGASAADFQNGDPRQYEANEAAVLPTYGPVTFRLEKSSTPVNLMAERAEKAMAALVDTVTVTRSQVSAGALTDWPAAVKNIENVKLEATGVYKKLLERLPVDLEGKLSSGLLNELQSIATNSSIAADFTAQLNKAKTEVGRFRNTLKGESKKLENQLIDGFTASVRQLADAPRKNFNDSVDQIIKDFNALKVIGVFEGVRSELNRQIDTVTHLPSDLPELFARYVELGVGLYAQFDDELTRIQGEIDGGLLQIAEATSRVEQLLHRGRDLIRSVEILGNHRPAPWIPDPTPVLKTGWVGFIKSLTAPPQDRQPGLDAYFRRFQAAADTLLREFPATPRAAIDTFRRTLDSPTELRKIAKDFFGIDADAFNYVRIRTEVRSAVEWYRTTLDTWEQILRDMLRTQVQAWVDAFNADPRRQTLERLKPLVNDWLSNEQQGLQKQVTQLQHDLIALAGSASGQVERAATSIAGLINEVEDILDPEKLKTELRDLARQWSTDLPLAELQKQIFAKRDEWVRKADQYFNQTAQRVMQDIPSTVFQQADNTLRLIRAFGDPPKVPKLDFDRSKIGYYFKELAPQIDMTPVIAVVNQGAEAIERLKPLGVKLPTRQALEQLIPVELKNFDLSTIFPNFAGMDLKNLFSGLKLPDIGNDNVRITHGLDEQTRRAFVRADVNFQMTESSTLFTIGPVSVQIEGAGFNATSIVDVGIDGKVRRKVNGKITGDWVLNVSGTPLITFRKTELFFDDAGGIRFSINPKFIEMSGILSFVADALNAVLGDDSGLSIALLPDGFQSVLNLPLPDIQAGAFGFSNLRITAALSLRFSNEFSIGLSCGIAAKEAPFSLTIFILGGGGYFAVRTTYTPANARLKGEIEVGITVSASLAISLGPISGGVYAYLGIIGRYVSGGEGLTIGVMFLLRGEVSVLGIVSASITLLLEASYNSTTKTLIGHGRVSIKIKICWCFTLDVSAEVTYTLGTPPNSQSEQVGALVGERRNLLASLNPAEDLAGAGFFVDDSFLKFATDYIHMLV